MKSARSSTQGDGALDPDTVDPERETNPLEPRPTDSFHDKREQERDEELGRTSTLVWVAPCDDGPTIYTCRTMGSSGSTVVDEDDFYEIGYADSGLDRVTLHAPIKQLMSDYGISGGALAIMSKDLRLVHAYGFTNLAAFARRGYPTESPRSASSSRMDAVSPTMRFRIGSISKAITATAVMRLRDRLLKKTGQDLLDSPIRDYFDIARVDPFLGERLGPITVRHLLAHSSGITKNVEPPEVAKYWDQCLPVIADDAIAYMAETFYLNPFNRPGAKAFYLNYGFLVLGKLVQELAGEDYADFVTAEVLEPFEMEDTVPGVTDAFTKGEARYYAAGYSCQCQCDESNEEICLTTSEVNPDGCRSGGPGSGSLRRA